MMSEWYGLPSEPAGGSPSPSPRPIWCQQPLPMLPSWRVCSSLLLLRDSAELGREAPSLNWWVSAGAGEPWASLLWPLLSPCMPSPGLPCSVSFQSHGGCRKPERLAALSPTSFHRPVFLSPWATATPSGLGVPASPRPSSDSEAGTRPSCGLKGVVVFN